jgi:hypothetical protein
MSRYTEKQLVELIRRVNDITASPDTAMSFGRTEHNTGHHYLKRGRDGYMLARITSAEGDCCDVFRAGWMTKPELGMRLDSFLLGLDTKHEVTP